eukprot:m.344262 g.344262  ORF g.344262 m.344262 type:complete len:289 (+) comp20643_c0_seq2:157-1023(+)
MAGDGSAVDVLVLPRRVLRWLQSIHLSTSVGRNPRREIANGYPIADILSRYKVKDGKDVIHLESFSSGTALDSKLANWSRLKKVFKAQGYPKTSAGLIDATMHCKPGAAEHLLLVLHAALTGSALTIDIPEDGQYSDAAYQASLPYHARSTVSVSIKSNLRPLELVTQPNQLKQTKFIETLVDKRKRESADDRDTNPLRYDRLPLNAQGLPAEPKPVPREISDTTKMKKSSKFLTMSQPIAPIGATATVTSRRDSGSANALGSVGPVGHTVKTRTKRLGSLGEPPQQP